MENLSIFGRYVKKNDIYYYELHDGIEFYILYTYRDPGFIKQLLPAKIELGLNKDYYCFKLLKVLDAQEEEIHNKAIASLRDLI